MGVIKKNIFIKIIGILEFFKFIWIYKGGNVKCLKR
jgi:hypothetical protein